MTRGENFGRTHGVTAGFVAALDFEAWIPGSRCRIGEQRIRPEVFSWMRYC